MGVFHLGTVGSEEYVLLLEHLELIINYCHEGLIRDPAPMGEKLGVETRMYVPGLKHRDT